MKPCKSADYFTKISSHIVVDVRQGESNIFQISTWKAFLLLKIYLLWKIRPIPVKGWKPVWMRACAIVLLVNLQQLALRNNPFVRLNVGASDCESRTYCCLRLKRQQYNWDGIRTLAGFILFRFFRSRSRVPVRFRSMLDSQFRDV